jgi:hypothetical protein
VQVGCKNCDRDHGGRFGDEALEVPERLFLALVSGL